MTVTVLFRCRMVMVSVVNVYEVVEILKDVTEEKFGEVTKLLRL
jgi:hypothetical protein